jgi:tRNA(adenine34) deaminase
MVRRSDQEYMEEALAEARRAVEIGEVPVGAVVVSPEGKILARGHNRRQIDSDPTGHAELIAIREAARLQGDWRLEGCTVYVTLEPCPMCAGTMIMSRIARCVYGCTDPKGGFLGTLGDLSHVPGINHHFEVTSGILAEESAELLRSFFRDLRAKRRR